MEFRVHVERAQKTSAKPFGYPVPHVDMGVGKLRLLPRRPVKMMQECNTSEKMTRVPAFTIANHLHETEKQT